MNNTHEIDFNKWCKKCKYHDQDEFDVDSVCYDCLDYPVNVDSTKPAMFVEAKS